MRWGEPTRLPPLRRGRGLAAAALLTVGLVAAYAILAVLSLTSVAPSFLDGVPTSIGDSAARAVPAVPTDGRRTSQVKSPDHHSELLGPNHLSSAGLLPGTTTPKLVEITNTSAAPLNLPDSGDRHVGHLRVLREQSAHTVGACGGRREGPPDLE